MAEVLSWIQFLASYIDAVFAVFAVLVGFGSIFTAQRDDWVCAGAIALVSLASHSAFG